MRAEAPQKIALCGSYRKPWRKIKVGAERLGEQAGFSKVSPVLYHGTERAVVESWLKNGMTSRSLSVAASPFVAASYTNYKLFRVNPDWEVQLSNNWGRRIRLFRCQHPAEFARLVRGLIIGSIAMFDRDSLLEGMVNLSSEAEGGGVYIRLLAGRQLNLSAMFGVLDFFPSPRDPMTYRVCLRVLDQKLWQENFDQPPPFKRRTFKLKPPLRFPQCQIVETIFG